MTAERGGPDSAPPDPTEAARRLARQQELPKRFYEEAQTVEENGAWQLRLDGRPARTPACHMLAAPTSALGEAIAAEWNAQAERINPATMPVTRLANSALDGVAARMDEVREDVVAYAGTDLLCYRAGEPEGLVERQNAAWDPILAWAEARFGVRFLLAEGVMHVRQPERTLERLRQAVASVPEPFALTGLHMATTLTGSALLALALAEGIVGTDEAWAAAHVDEDWNMQLWGEDEEALARRARRLIDFRAAALALGQAG